MDWLHEIGALGLITTLAGAVTIVGDLPLLAAFRHRLVVALYFLVASGPLILGGLLSLARYLALAGPLLEEGHADAETISRIWEMTLRPGYIGAAVTLVLVALGLARLMQSRARSRA